MLAFIFFFLAAINVLIDSLPDTELCTPQFPKVNRSREVENGSSKAWIKVGRDWLNTRDGQMERKEERKRERGRGERHSSPTSTTTRATRESPAVHALRPWAHAWPISLRSKRARFSKTYGLNNVFALFPQGWTGEWRKRQMCAPYISASLLWVCIWICVSVLFQSGFY